MKQSCVLVLIELEFSHRKRQMLPYFLFISASVQQVNKRYGNVCLLQPAGPKPNMADKAAQAVGKTCIRDINR